MAKKSHHRVSAAGIELGKTLTQIVERSVEKLASEEDEKDARCSSCALRPGTVPNGCLQTQLDVLKAVVEDVVFMCHDGQKKGQPCYGWFAARIAIEEAQAKGGAALPFTSCPWDFSPPDEET